MKILYITYVWSCKKVTSIYGFSNVYGGSVFCSIIIIQVLKISN